MMSRVEGLTPVRARGIAVEPVESNEPDGRFGRSKTVEPIRGAQGLIQRKYPLALQSHPNFLWCGSWVLEGATLVWDERLRWSISVAGEA
jgi:hypothetical protein